MGGGHVYLSLDYILTPPAKDVIDDIGAELNDDGEIWHTDPRRFLMAKTGFQKFAWKIQKRIFSQQRYIEVIQTALLVSLRILSKVLLTMRMWRGYASINTL